MLPRSALQVRSHNEFLMGMRVTKAMAGKTVQKSGMRQLPNAFLVAIDRAGATLHAVSPDEELEVDDILWFAGGWRRAGGMAWLLHVLSQNPRPWVLWPKASGRR